MAKDFKTMTVPPDLEVDAIQLWTTFGYELFGNQEVLSKDTHIEQGMMDVLCDTYTQVQETTHYIKLTFQRDPGIPHYDELKKLEDEFEALASPGEPPTRNGIIKILIGLMICTIPGIIFLCQDLGFNSRNAEYNKRFDAYVEKREAILEKAEKLCS